MEKLRLFLVEKREHAWQFCTTPRSGRDGLRVWLPRSQIERYMAFGAAPGEWPECEVQIPSWLARAKKLI